MEPFYSSDEEIAWGPVTLKEIKRDLLRPRKKALSRRYSSIGKFNYNEPATTAIAPTKEMSDPVTLTNDIEKLNVSKASTEYFTPDTTMKDKNCPEVDKHTNEPSASTYVSETEHIHESRDQTYLNFVENVGSVTKFNIQNIEQTLVENTIIISSGDESSDEEDRQNVIIKSEKEESYNITLSSESDQDHGNESILSDEELANESKNSGNNSVSNGNLKEVTDSPKSDVSIQDHFNFNDTFEIIEQILQKPVPRESASEPEKECDQNEYGDSCEDEGNESMSSDKENLQKLNLSESYNMDNLSFNDTMEEMQRALQEGLDYTMPSDEKKIKSNPSSSTKPNKITPTSLIPIATTTPNQEITKTLFKLPIKPVSPFTSANKYKNIKSPIHIYIHKGLSPCLKQNVSVRNDSKTFVSPKVRKPSDDKSEFPKIVYKPAKLKVVNREREVHLPSNIQKLVKEKEVTRHEKKIKPSTRETIVSQNLFDTNISANLTLLNNSSQDVSIVTKTQTY